MIRLTDITIENFRYIVGAPLTLSFDDYNVVVGPNNCGKSNILRACELFFNGTVDARPYDASLDFPRVSGLGNRAQSKFTVGMTFEPAKDSKVEKAIAELERESGQKRLEDDVVRIRLEYSRQNAVQWKFISRAGLRSIRSDLVVPVVEAIRSAVRFKYLPVGRNILETIRSELSEELIRTIFSGWSGAVRARKDINEAIDLLIEKLQPRLKSSGSEVTEAIANVFTEIRRLELRLPFTDLETLLPSLVPACRDHHETGLDYKGAGIQTSALLFLLKYLADHHPQRHNMRVTYIWAVEEPESYLHPARQKAMARVLQEFAGEVQTVITTHSPHFVPRGGVAVNIVDKAEDPPFGTKMIGNDYEQARQLLGVSLLDSMYLYPINVVVEGPSDEILLRGAWGKLYENKRVTIDPMDVRFFPGNGATGACTLFESLLSFGDNGEVAIVLIIDGDSAGDKALRGLLKRTSSTMKLKSNHDYFLLEEDTEWLAAAEVMEKLAKERPSQVSVTTNTKNEITAFLVDDGQKKKVAKRIIEVSSVDDLLEFEKLIKRIERVVTK